MVISVRGAGQIFAGRVKIQLNSHPDGYPGSIKVSYSGMVIGLQVGIVCAGFTPLLGTVLIGCREG